MTKFEKELSQKTGRQLIKEFDYICVRMTHECNSKKGVVTQKTAKEYEYIKKELLARMGEEYIPFSEVIE